MQGLFQKMIKAQDDSGAMLELINQFTPLIRKYSFLLLLDFDDAISELTAEFIRIIKDFPGKQEFSSDMFVLSYINKAVRHAYIAISKKQAHFNLLYSSEYTHFEQGYEPQNILWLEDLLSVLTKNQKKVIILKYLYDYSDIEIAQNLNVSRQAVNQIKNRAFQKLKPFIQQ